MGDRNGTIRVGRLDGGTPHLLVGHEGLIVALALSPDRRKVLLAKLRSLTNLRAVRTPDGSIGCKNELGPFPGWKDVPTW